MTSLSDNIRERYTDLINQSANISQNIAEKIQMADLADGTTELVTKALVDVEKACSKETFGEKCVSLLPALLSDKIQSKMDHIDRINIKNSNIAEVATRHFDTLSSRRDTVKANIMALYDIREKLDQSQELLIAIKDDLTAGMEELKLDNSAASRKDLLVCKELSIQIASQVAVQMDLTNQLDMVDFTAEMVLDTINQTLPDLKSNFIDQISITTALENLKTFKDSVDRTRQMTIGLQEQTFENTKRIMTDITDQGVGLKKVDIIRLEKLNDEKQKLGKNISQTLVKNSLEMDDNLERINKMIDNTKSSFEIIGIDDLSGKVKPTDNRKTILDETETIDDMKNL